MAYYLLTLERKSFVEKTVYADRDFAIRVAEEYTPEPARGEDGSFIDGCAGEPCVRYDKTRDRYVRSVPSSFGTRVAVVEPITVVEKA